MSNIQELYHEWQVLQPLKPEDQRRLDEKFRMEFNYNSNHLEGNTLTYGETELLLVFGQTDGSHDFREYEEIKAHDLALKMIKEEAKDSDRPLTENFIRLLNKTILVTPFWKDAETPDGQKTRVEVKIGEYKSRPNHVRTQTGEIFYYATPEETPSLMHDLVMWFNKAKEEGVLTPLELAALLHYRYIRIHPFEDGNGRIARLLVNYVLLSYGYPPIIIQTADKENYLKELRIADINTGLDLSNALTKGIESIVSFVDYMENRLQHSLMLAVKAAKGENIEEEDDWEKALTLKLRGQELSIYSEEAVKKVLEKSMYPLAKAIDDKFLKFESFFTEVGRIFSGEEYISIPSLDEIKDNFFNPDFSKNVFHYIAEYKRWILDSSYKFDYQLLCFFEERRYEVELHAGDKKKMTIEKKYNQYLSKSEIKEMVNFVGKELAEFIDKLTND